MFSGEVDNGLIFYIIFTATDALMQDKEVKREKKRKGRWGRRGEGMWWEKARFLYAGFKTCEEHYQKISSIFRSPDAQ